MAHMIRKPGMMFLRRSINRKMITGWSARPFQFQRVHFRAAVRRGQDAPAAQNHLS